jgi:mTERF domain-containing protein
MISRLQFNLSSMGSFDRLHIALKRSPYLLTQNLEQVVKPNMAFLLQCGLTASDFARLSHILVSKLERVKQMVACAEEKLGAPRNTGMFKRAMCTVESVGPDSIAAKLDLVKATLGCTEAELALAVHKAPHILVISQGNLSRTLKFLNVDAGLKLQYILQRTPILGYSLQRRLMPRHYFISILKAKELVKESIDFYSVVSCSEKTFVQKFIDPHSKTIPGLADAYATACAGKIPHDIEL